MSAMNFIALVMIMATIAIFVEVIIGLNKMHKQTMALVQDYDRAWGTDKENAA